MFELENEDVFKFIGGFGNGIICLKIRSCFMRIEVF